MGLFDLFKRKPQDKQEPAAADPAGPGKMRLALNRTRAFFASAFATDPEGLVDEEYYDTVVDNLVLADVGVELAEQLTERIKQEMHNRGLVFQRDAAVVARDVLAQLLQDTREVVPLEPGKLSVILMVGVNGSGKTTLSAKLAHRLKSMDFKVLLVAADTFRAAAVDQLKIWADRAKVEIVAGQEGADPAAVVFDAAQAAQARGAEVMIVDTAGRLQTKQNLMSELSKIARTVDKACPGAEIAHVLVLDATVGQNAMSQAELFNECCPLTGLALTKLDGTARGGAVFAVVEQLKAPVLYIGVGEGIDDMLEFDAAEFTRGLLPD